MLIFGIRHLRYCRILDSVFWILEFNGKYVPEIYGVIDYFTIGDFGIEVCRVGQRRFELGTSLCTGIYGVIARSRWGISELPQING